VDSGRAALEALDAAQKHDCPFSLILVDGQMPEMDGFTLANLIKKDPAFADAIIMMLTSADNLAMGPDVVKWVFPHTF